MMAAASVHTKWKQRWCIFAGSISSPHRPRPTAAGRRKHYKPHTAGFSGLSSDEQTLPLHRILDAQERAARLMTTHCLLRTSSEGPAHAAGLSPPPFRVRPLWMLRQISSELFAPSL